MQETKKIEQNQDLEEGLDSWKFLQGAYKNDFKIHPNVTLKNKLDYNQAPEHGIYYQKFLLGTYKNDLNIKSNANIVSASKAIASVILMVFFINKILHALEIGEFMINCYGNFMLKSVFLFNLIEEFLKQRMVYMHFWYYKMIFLQSIPFYSLICSISCLRSHHYNPLIQPHN